jgi:hypothetical protein
MSNWLTGCMDEGTVADVPKEATCNSASATFGMVFEEEHVNILHERALGTVCTTEKG